MYVFKTCTVKVRHAILKYACRDFIRYTTHEISFIIVNKWTSFPSCYVGGVPTFVITVTVNSKSGMSNSSIDGLLAHAWSWSRSVCWQYKQCCPFPPEVAELLLGTGLRPLTLLSRLSHRCSICDKSGRNASQRKTSTLLAARMWLFTLATWYRALSCLNVNLSGCSNGTKSGNRMSLR